VLVLIGVFVWVSTDLPQVQGLEGRDAAQSPSQGGGAVATDGIPPAEEYLSDARAAVMPLYLQSHTSKSGRAEADDVGAAARW
jgi:hypothetical protein